MVGERRVRDLAMRAVTPALQRPANDIRISVDDASRRIALGLAIVGVSVLCLALVLLAKD